MAGLTKKRKRLKGRRHREKRKTGKLSPSQSIPFGVNIIRLTPKHEVKVETLPKDLSTSSELPNRPVVPMTSKPRGKRGLVIRSKQLKRKKLMKTVMNKSSVRQGCTSVHSSLLPSSPPPCPAPLQRTPQTGARVVLGERHLGVIIKVMNIFYNISQRQKSQI